MDINAYYDEIKDLTPEELAAALYGNSGSVINLFNDAKRGRVVKDDITKLSMLFQLYFDKVSEKTGQDASDAEDAKDDVETLKTLIEGEIDGLLKGVETLIQNNAFDVVSLAGSPATGTSGGVTYTWNDGVCTADSGGVAAGSTSYSRIINSTSALPPGIYPGRTYKIKANSYDSTKLYLQLYPYINGVQQTGIEITGEKTVKLAANVTGILFRVRAKSGEIINGTIRPEMVITAEDVEEVRSYAKTRLDNLIENSVVDVAKLSGLKTNETRGSVTYTWSNGVCTVSSGSGTAGSSFNNILNSERALPEGIQAGRSYLIRANSYDSSKVFLQLFPFKSGTMQTGIDITTDRTITLDDDVTGIILRIRPTQGKSISGTIRPEMLAVPTVGGGGGGSGTGGDVYYNTYNITTTPTISVDDNGWLESAGDDTDMTGAIMSLLTDTGVARLGPGVFYVAGIDMPKYSRIEGCGTRTILILKPSLTSGYAIRMSQFNEVANLRIRGTEIGSTLDFTGSSVVRGNRDGIRFEANYDGSPSVSSEQCYLSHVHIQYFSGAGLFCSNTSINYAKGLYVSNCTMNNCYAGIDISYLSEFNKFTNVCISWCRIACYNDSGNNGFVNCTFHATEKGFVMDNSERDKPNDSHGYMTGCTFCHIGSNAGVAIYINNQANGFTFSSSQVWYNSVSIINSEGIVFTGVEFGRGTTGAGATIDISGGETILFNGCMFQNDDSYAPAITVTDNTKVKLCNCFGSSTGDEITLN